MSHRLSRGWLLAALLALLTVAGGTVAAVERSAAHDPATTQAAPVPLRGFSTHIVATHYLGGRAYRAVHYFKQLRPGVLQGLVVRHRDPSAPVIELEWAISTERYRALPAAQRRHWHPLGPAVDAGRITLPDLSDDAERRELAGIRGLYAQTLNAAGIDGGLPRGVRGVRSVTHLAPGEHGHR
jgi:hypothetical protein